MNATRLSVRLANAVAMPFAPTILAAFLVLASQDTQEIPKLTVTTSTNAPMTKESAAARPSAKTLQVHSNAHVSMEHPSIPSQNAVEVLCILAGKHKKSCQDCWSKWHCHRICQTDREPCRIHRYLEGMYIFCLISDGLAGMLFPCITLLCGFTIFRPQSTT